MENFLKFGLLGLSAVAVLTGAALSVAGPPGTPIMAFMAAALLFAGSVIARSARLGALVTAAVCFGANAYLFSRKWESAKATEALCNINSVINCDIVNSSSASEMFGIPITLFGLGFYGGLVIAAIGRDEDSQRFHRISAAFAVFNLGYSAYLGYHSYLLGAICVMCITIYIGNALLLWAGIRGIQQTPGGFDLAELLPSREFLTVAGTFAVLVAAGGMAWQNQHPATVVEKAKEATDSGKTLSPEMLAGLYEQPSGTVELDGTEPIYGSSTAKYLVVEWADYGCPHCADASHELKPWLKEHKDVQLRFKVFPLTGDCNPALEPHGNERCLAAYAAECARPQGRYFEMSSLLFENQGYFQPTDLEYIASQVGLDIPTWKKCLDAPETKEGILADAAAGVKAGVRGTPSMYVRGTHGDQWIAIKGGPDALMAVLSAAEAGTQLLPPAPPSPAEH